MKNRIHKILGIGLALVLALALVAGFALPVAASPGENEWEGFDYPAEGELGDWFRDASITVVGPMAEAINGDIYAYVELGPGPTHHLFKSDDEGRAWADTGYDGGAIVDMVCSSLDEDIIYVTDGNYVYKSTDAGDEFAKVAPDTLEELLMGTCGTPIAGQPITCLDVTYDDDDDPYVFIGVGFTHIDSPSEGEPSVLNLYEAGYGTAGVWTDLKLHCFQSNTIDEEGTLVYYPGNYTPYSIGCPPDWADTKETYVVVSRTPSPLAKLSYDGGGGSSYVEFTPDPGITVSDLATITTGWSFWYYLEAGASNGPLLELRFCAPDCVDPDGAGHVDITVDTAENSFTTGTWIEVQITSSSTAFDYGNDPVDGTSWGAADQHTLATILAAIDAETAMTDHGSSAASWELTRVRAEIGYSGNARTCYIKDITIDATAYDLPGDTHVVSTVGTPCSWNEFAELFQNCDVSNPFVTKLASRIGFPDDWEDTETLFVGVVDNDDPTYPGGDVYSVISDGAVDRNVEDISGGCVGLMDYTNIISLDIYGDTDEASLIAGAYDDTNVYYSIDGGWSWDISAKDPTGVDTTYVLWYEDSALAATADTECAVSLSCGDEVGEYWNQISLIATDITTVEDISHSPGYIVDSETLFMLSSGSNESLFRYDGTYWERVFESSQLAESNLDMVLVSPDFNDTNAIFVANTGFEIWRSLDAGCSWKKFTFPCETRPTISAWVVIDEDTVITGGAGDDLIYKTTRHGARPWDEYDLPAVAGEARSFDLEPGYEDPGTILLGDNSKQVFISEDGGEEWELVGDCAEVLATGNTSVVFDPAYATSDIIYAAAGNVIARCVIDWDEDWADQEWEEIYKAPGDCDPMGAYLSVSGIVAAGDTALYVADETAYASDTCGTTTSYTDGGVLRSLNPDTDDADEVVFERVTAELDPGRTLSGLQLTTGSNVLWSLDIDDAEVWTYEDTLATPVVLDMPLDSQKLTTTTKATLSWLELDEATLYEVSLYRYCPECPDLKEEVTVTDTEETCITVKDLETGSLYYWQVRVALGEPTLSKWSEERTFSTALVAVVDLCSPVCGGQDIILTPNFSWDKVDGATGYDIELATTETFTAGVVKGSSTVNAWVTQPLEYATTYYWRVRAEKDGVYSDWSVCIFTTLEEPVVPPPPVVVEPTPPAPVVPTPIIEFPPTPSWVWAIIGIGTALMVVVIVLTVRTRRPPA